MSTRVETRGRKKDPFNKQREVEIKKLVTANVLARLREQFGTFDYDDRGPDNEVVPGLLRKNFREFMQLARTIRNRYAYEQAGRKTSRTMRAKRDAA